MPAIDCTEVMTYNSNKKLLRTETFKKWIKGIKDSVAKAKVLARTNRFRQGNPGDFRNLRKGVTELRIDYGPGHRVYCLDMDKFVLLLAGGDKSTQEGDIRTVYRILEESVLWNGLRNTT